jgi:hypothetical protein
MRPTGPAVRHFQIRYFGLPALETNTGTAFPEQEVLKIE